MKRALIIFVITVISIVSLPSITAFVDVSFLKEEGIQEQSIDVNAKYELCGEKSTVHSFDMV